MVTFLILTIVVSWVGFILALANSHKKPNYEQDDEFLEVMADMEETNSRQLQSVFDSLNARFTKQLNEFKSNVGNVLANLKTTDAQVVAKINLLKQYFDIEEYTTVEVSDTQGIKQETGMREIPATLTPKFTGRKIK